MLKHMMRCESKEGGMGGGELDFHMMVQLLAEVFILALIGS